MSQPNDPHRFENAPEPPDGSRAPEFSLTTPELEAYLARAVGDPDAWRGEATSADIAATEARDVPAGLADRSGAARELPRVIRSSPATPGAPEGVPFPGTEAASRPHTLAPVWHEGWVTVFRPDETAAIYAQVLSVDVGPGRVVAQTEHEVVELEVTPDLTFFLGPINYRTKLTGERGALVADRLLDLLVTTPRPTTAKFLMESALAVVHEPAGPRDGSAAKGRKKRGWFW